MSGAQPWQVVPSPTDPEMYAVEVVYLVADNLPIEDARLIASAPALLEALELLLAYDQDANPESVDFMLAYDRALTATKAAIAAAKGEST